MRISRIRFFTFVAIVLSLVAVAAVTGGAGKSNHGSDFSLSRSGQPASTQASGTVNAVSAAAAAVAPADGAITFDHATLNDAVRMVGEPDVAIDHAGGIYVSGPGGSTTQTSWFWKSDDGGVQWHLVGCPAKSNCQNGGGDTEIAIANNDDVFASDLQTLQCNSTFRSFDHGASFLPGEGCFPETDRQWMAVYDPNGSATGRRVYLAANHANVGSGCYLLVSTDNGVTYQPPDPATNAQGNIGGSCIGRMAVDPNNGDIFVPTSGGTTRVSTDGGKTWQARGSSGAQGHFFAPIQIDTAGNLWQAWTEGSKAFVSYSTNRGVSWHAKLQVSTGPNSPVGTSPDLRQMLFPWLAVGDAGRVAVVFYGTTDTGTTGGYPGSPNALWHVYASLSTNAMDASPTFTQVQADEHVMHRGAICTGGFPDCLTNNSDRSMADFFMVDKDPQGRIYIAYNENSDLSQVTPGQFIGKPINAVIRLRTGPSLFASKGNLLPNRTPANATITSASPSGGALSISGTHGLPPGNWSADPAGDAPFPVVPIASANHAALDLTEISAADDGTNLTFKLKLADLSAPALADAQTLGTPSWLVTWWEGKGGIGPANMTSGPFQSHWFVKWLGGTNFVYGKVSSADAPALGAPTPKFLTYAPAGTASGSVSGNTVTISVPLASLAGLAPGDKIDQVTGYTLADHGGDVTASDQVDQAKSFSYLIGTPAAKQHLPDGYVEVSLDPTFATYSVATLNPLDNTWTASLANAPSSGYVYARQVLSSELYTPLWDDVRAGPDAQLVYPTATRDTISFAHPTMAGIDGDGFELDLRPDPATPSTMYAGAPGASSANTSWIWKTTDTGKTWKWVTGAAPFNGKVQATTPHCLGGGDTEIAVDHNHHIYFNDLSGAGGVPLEFSTGRSDDGGASFVCDTAGVPDAGVDRQWYALVGDPTLNGGDQVDQNTLYLTNDIIGNGTSGCVGGNQLVMYRSPIPSLVGAPTPNEDAGRTFGPHFTITCDEGIMGNNEVSPIATKRAENGTLTLSTAVRHVFVAHDNAALNKISVGRCFPVAVGPATANTSDPSGLRCVDKLVANLAGAGARTGANFPTTAIDAAGNVYVTWEEKVGAGQTLVKLSYSLDEGETWSAPITLPNNAPSNVVGGKELGGPLNTNVMAWPVAGDDGRLDVVFYGSNAVGASPDTANGYYSLWLTQSLNAHDANPTFSAPVLASEHFIHKGTMNTLIGNQSGDRALGDFIQVRMGPRGEAMISYADSNNAHHADTPHAMFVRQTTGASLLASVGTVNIGGLAPDQSVTDPAGDAMYQAAGQSSANIPNLDLTGSSVAKVSAGSSATSACPSTAASGCYRIEMDVANMSLTAPPFPDTDRDLVWLTQWLVPSTSDALGGKNLFVYAESFAGGALQCFTGQNGEFTRFFAVTYPGTVQITNPASCAETDGAGGKVVVTVPLSTLVGVAGSIDSDLHEVRAATLTQAAQGNSDASGQGLLFNEIDGAQTYVFTPVQADVSVSVTDSPDPVGVGQRLAYTITASNAGPDAAAGVNVADALPGGTLVSAVASQGSCSGTATVNCSLGSIASGGSATVTIVLNAPNTAQTLTNTASVSSSTFDPSPDNNSATTTTAVSADANVAVDMTDSPDPVNVGDNLTYTISVPNFGPAAATGVTVNSGLPSTVTFVSANTSQGGPCVKTSSLSCPLGSIAPGDSATVTIVVAVGPNTFGTLTNSAFVTATSPDSNAANNSTTATTTVRGSIAGAIKNDSSGAGIGGVTVFLDTDGDGKPTAGEPTRTTGASGGYTFTGLVEGTYRVDYDASTLPSGFRNSGTKPLTVDLAAGAAAAGENFSATPFQADLRTTMTADQSTAHLKKALTYTLTVTNLGPADAKTLTLTDVWSKTAEFTSFSTDGKGSCTVKKDRQTLTCTLSALAQAAGSNVWTIKLVLKPTMKPSVVNTSTVSSTTPDPDAANNKATLTTPVAP